MIYQKKDPDIVIDDETAGVDYAPFENPDEKDN